MRPGAAGVRVRVFSKANKGKRQRRAATAWLLAAGCWLLAAGCWCAASDTCFACCRLLLLRPASNVIACVLHLRALHGGAERCTKQHKPPFAVSRQSASADGGAMI